MGSSYKDAGVDIDAGAEAVSLMKAAVNATHGPAVLAGVGAFGGLFDASNLQGMKSPVLAASTDGVGTKTRVASQLGKYDTIGACLVNHCIDDILVQGARPLFFLDYFATSKLDPKIAADVVRGAAEACKAAGCALLGGETAEMPGVYEAGEIDLAGTIIGVVERDSVIDGSKIAPGDAVIGIASTGLHTNGYSLARKILEGRDFTAPLDELDGKSIGDALLAIHRSYLDDVSALLDAGVEIKGLAHITGGGLVENPPRILPDAVSMEIQLGTWDVLPIFKLLQSLGKVELMEMLRVFNMGLGMLVVVPEAQAELARETCKHQAWRVGKIVERASKPVVFTEVA